MLLSVGGGLFAACSAPSDDSPFPDEPGRWWYYRTGTVIRGEPQEQRFYVKNLRSNGPTFIQRRQAKWDHMYVHTARGIVHQGYIDRTSGRAREAGALVLPARPVVGAKWTASSQLGLIESRTFAPEDRLRGRHLPVELEATVASTDAAVDTPAGHFAHCIRVDSQGTATVLTDRAHTEVQVTVEQQDWYAPGIGLVKTIRREHADSNFLRDGSYALELLDSGS